jgi:hypothetical protein
VNFFRRLYRLDETLALGDAINTIPHKNLRIALQQVQTTVDMNIKDPIGYAINYQLIVESKHGK